MDGGGSAITLLTNFITAATNLFVLCWRLRLAFCVVVFFLDWFLCRDFQLKMLKFYKSKSILCQNRLLTTSVWSVPKSEKCLDPRQTIGVKCGLILCKQTACIY